MSMGRWGTFVVLAASLAFASDAALAAKQKWTVKGKVQVQHVMPELAAMHGSQSGVPGVEIKVSARSKIPFGWGTWSNWGTYRTKADGSFEVSKERGSDRRQFRIKVLFDSDRLRLKEGKETPIVSFDNKGFPIDLEFDLTDKDWFIVHNDKNKKPDGRKAGVTDLGNIVIRSGTERKLADLWVLYDQMFDLMSSYGSAYAFKNKISVKYPQKLFASSYANPYNNNVYLRQEQYSARTALHEMLHVYLYQRTTGEDKMTMQAIKHRDTHQERENTTYVPHHEGFAEWAAYKVLKEISDGELDNFVEDAYYTYPHMPLSREYISEALAPSEQSVANVDYTERGWHSLFNILTYSFLDRLDFNERYETLVDGKLNRFKRYAKLQLFTGCSEMAYRYSFKDILSIYLRYPARGIDRDLDTDGMNFRTFLARARIVLDGFDREDERHVKTYLSPVATKNPCELAAS